MSKLSPLISLLALAAALQACHDKPVTEDGSASKMQRSEQAAAPGRSSGAGAATYDTDWLRSDLSILTTLSDENFTDALVSTEHALVIFYAPYSGHCKVGLPPLLMLKSLPGMPQQSASGMHTRF